MVLALVVLTCAAGLGVWALRSSPEVWRAHRAFLDRTTPAERMALVDSAMRKLDAAAQGAVAPVSASLDDTASGLRPADRRIDLDTVLVLTNDELAALVAEKYDDFLRQRGFNPPENVHDPLLAVEDGRLVLGFAYRTGGWSQVFSGEFDLAFGGDGMAELGMRSMSAGKLPLPATGVADFLAAHHPGQPRERWERVADWMQRLEGLEFRPVLELSHRRRARVTGYEVLEEGVRVSVRLQDHATYKEMNLAMARAHGMPEHMTAYFPDGLPEVEGAATPTLAGVPTD
ncbi:MAG: hypothetical protein AAF288_07850 [Planctomycetota bacterium]